MFILLFMICHGSAVFEENWENEVKLNELKRQKVKMSNTGQQVQQLHSDLL